MSGDAPTKGGRNAGQVLDLERYVPGLITFLANKLSRGANFAYRQRFGLTVTEWRILSQLRIEPDIPASRICQVIGFDKGPVSRNLAGLEAKGLLASHADESDARRRLIRLTPAGAALHDRVIAVALDREARLLACLSVSEREALIGLLCRLHDNLDALERAGVEVPSRRQTRHGAGIPAARDASARRSKAASRA